MIDDSILLLPMPQTMTHCQGHVGVDMPAAALAQVGHIDAAAVAQSQGYRLTIDGDVTLVAHDAAGLFYGRKTLGQLIAQFGAKLPRVRIEDWPDYPRRGVMLDVSRDKVPTLATLRRLVDKLADWKINQLQLYTEHTFAFAGHEAAWRDASPITPAEMRHLDDYCRQRFVELVPNQNSFGHMGRWLKLPEYRHLAETSRPWRDPWGTIWDEPMSLCPTDPACLNFLAGLYDQLLPCFSSRMFSVGCDETWDVGEGRSKHACEQRGAGQVYLDFLLKIYELVKQRNRTMMFWGDIVLKHPQLIRQLPKDVVALVWGYCADYPFDEKTAMFEAAGVPFYVCPGTSMGNAIAGQIDNALVNITSAATAGLKHGAIGLLNTEWGDNGHWQPLAPAYLPMAWGAAMSWAPTANRALDLCAAMDLHCFADQAGVTARVIHNLGLACRKTKLPLLNQIRHDHPLVGYDEPLPHGLTSGTLEEGRAWIKQAVAPLADARMRIDESALIIDELRYAALMLEHACQLSLARLRHDGVTAEALPAATRKTLAEHLGSVLEAHRAVWLARNREGGWIDSVRPLHQLALAYGGQAAT
ncbi:MAG: family 20 glycosylhydrolase [Phycisphaeraceae bacterium]